MKELQGIFKVIDKIGKLLISGAKYQFFFLVYVLRGFILIGFFPSLAAVFQCLYNQIRKKTDVKNEAFKSYYKEYFKLANQLGYFFSSILVFLWIDLKISSLYIHMFILHLVLLIFFLLVLGSSLYSFPAICRYQLTFKQYIQRSFLLFLSSIPETIAMVIGIGLATILINTFVILLFVASVPLISFPIVWFSIQGMEKIEKRVLRS